MLTQLKRQWQGLGRGEPGRRFQDRYTVARRRKDTPLWHRVLRLAAAAAAFAVGVVLVFIPGPAIVFFALGGALLAMESRAAAVALDAMELGARSLGQGLGRVWRRLGWAGRTGLVSAGILAGVAVAVLAAWLFYTR